MLLHLKIDGKAVTGSTSNNVLSDYAHWLECDVDNIYVNGNTIYLTWLRERLDTIPANPTPEDLLIYFRLYLLQFIGTFLMPEPSNSKVSVRYLPLSRDPETVSQYSWGSACLATLYKGLCVMVDTSIKQKKITVISGCGFLLQAWARFRIKCCSHVRRYELEDVGPYALRQV
jgi:hypothetical protein